MILVGLTGGMRQGKSTVGAELRKLAQVDEKADLEFSYVISEVCSGWLKTWAPSVLDSGDSVINIANRLIPSLAEPVKAYTGLEFDPEILRIEDTDQGREESNRLLSYLEKFIEAGAARDEEFPQPIVASNKVLHRLLLQWVGARLIDEVDRNIWVNVVERRIKQLDERGYKLATIGGVRYPENYVMVRRNGGVVVQVQRPEIASDDDITERAGDGERADIIVQNNGTVEQLLAVVQTLYNDLVTDRAKSSYTAV